MEELRARTLRLANGTHLLSVARDPGPEAPSLADALERVPRYEDVLLNLDDATPFETTLAYAAIASSPRVHQHARPIVIVSSDSSLRWLLDAGSLGRRVLIEPTLADALRFLVGSRWLSTFAEAAAYASTSP
jgi:hypothetical protein